MSPRTGRPPKENPRNCDINIRLTKQELMMIEFVAESLEMTRTDAIIRGIEMLRAEIENK